MKIVFCILLVAAAFAFASCIGEYKFESQGRTSLSDWNSAIILLALFEVGIWMI